MSGDHYNTTAHTHTCMRGYSFNIYSVLDLSGVWGFNPLWCLSKPQVFIDPTNLVNNSQKYIATPFGSTTHRVRHILISCFVSPLLWPGPCHWSPETHLGARRLDHSEISSEHPEAPVHTSVFTLFRPPGAGAIWRTAQVRALQYH